MLELVRRQPPGLLNPLVRAQYLRLRATFAPSAQEDPRGDLRQAVAGLAAFGAPFPRAQAELALAEQIAADDAAEAAVLLDSAAATFRELGAQPWLDRASAVLTRV
jgi:hypothetical protein